MTKKNEVLKEVADAENKADKNARLFVSKTTRAWLSFELVNGRNRR